jgi:hypothetical protein
VALFMDQVLRFWLETEVIRTDPGSKKLLQLKQFNVAAGSGGAAAGVASIIVSRFDRLSADLQITLKTATVLGKYAFITQSPAFVPGSFIVENLI